MKNFLKITLLVGLLTAFPVFAKNDNLDIELLSGNNLNGGKLFKTEGILPGWEASEIVRIKNDNQENDIDLYMKFDIENGKTLAKMLKLYVIQINNSNYEVGGDGDRYNLKEADEKGSLFIDRLDPEEKKYYKIQLVFEETASNDYQGLSTEFDIDFKIEGKESDDETVIEEILASQGRIESSETITLKEQAEIISEIQEAEKSQSPVEDELKFPWWLLLLLLLILLAYYLYNKYKKYKGEQKKNPKNKMRNRK